MKILYVNTYYYPNTYGGAEVSIQLLAEYMAQKYHDIYVLCIDNTEKEEVINGVRIYRIKKIESIFNSAINKKIDMLIQNTYNIYLYKKIKQYLQRVKPDLVHTNNLMFISPIVWKIAKELKIPIVHTCRDYMLIQKKVYKKWIINKTSKIVNGVTSPSQYTLDVYLNSKLFSGATIRKAVCNALACVKINEELKEKKQRKSECPIRFAYLGRYEEYKGIKWLLDIFSQEVMNELLFFGHGTMEQEINDKLIESPNIFNRGFLEQKELYEELEKVDVIIVPSIWEEPFGRVILDAYLNLCPVIVTNKGGMPELVVNGKTGLVVECNMESLVDAIRYMSDRTKIKLMFPYIAEQIKKYSIQNQANDFMDIYRKVCD